MGVDEWWDLRRFFADVGRVASRFVEGVKQGRSLEEQAGEASRDLAWAPVAPYAREVAKEFLAEGRGVAPEWPPLRVLFVPAGFFRVEDEHLSVLLWERRRFRYWLSPRQKGNLAHINPRRVQLYDGGSRFQARVAGAVIEGHRHSIVWPTKAVMARRKKWRL